MLVHSYLKSFNLPVIIARCTNVFGPHRYPEKIISKFICQLNRGQPVTLQGDGSPTRRLLYAGDAASAFDTILHKGQVGQIYNIGADVEISNRDLCRKLLEEFQISQSTPGDVQKWVTHTPDRIAGTRLTTRSSGGLAGSKRLPCRRDTDDCGMGKNGGVNSQRCFCRSRVRESAGL
jgi:dTDP-D-glucose 4,6-dehydratase